MARLLVLILLFAAELIGATIAFDGVNLLAASGPTAWLRNWGPWVLRFIVGFSVIFLGFSLLDNRSAFERAAAKIAGASVRWPLLILHGLAFAAFLFIGARIYGGGDAAGYGLVGLWLLTALSAGLLALGSLIPAPFWLEYLRATGLLWLWAAVGSFAACSAIRFAQSLWEPTRQLTFDLVLLVLHPLLPSLETDPATFRISTNGFGVRIAPECSGLEGMALLVVLGTLWLVLFRREYRFPQAILLLPVGVALLYAANVVRLVLLIMIGNAGAQEIAIGGFHSQAGWISFNVIAFSLCVMSRKVQWTSALPAGGVYPVEHDAEGSEHDANPVAPYLMPFLAILAASMLATAATGSFEWLFPLRFLAAAGVLWAYRQQYRELDGSSGFLSSASVGFSAAVGLGVLVFWLAMDQWTSKGPQGMPLALAGIPAVARYGWIALRVLSAVVATPIAEELAFRGFLLRRFAAAEFETVTDFRSASGASLAFGLAGSSLVFGALHGAHWIAGAVTGVIYGLAMLRRGRLGEAIVAHAITNAGLAVIALVGNRWDLWG